MVNVKQYALGLEKRLRAFGCCSYYLFSFVNWQSKVFRDKLLDIRTNTSIGIAITIRITVGIAYGTSVDAHAKYCQ
jgi:hypothetical protein